MGTGLHFSDFPTNQVRAELFDFSIRNLVRERPTLAIRRTRGRDPIWGEHFHLSVGSIRVLGARHPWLHFFQSWMYLATIALSLRGNRWGYFIGISAAGLWDHMNIFATTFFYNGLQQLTQWFHTGHLARPDILIAVPAWFSNLLVIIGCLWAYARRSSKNPRDTAKFVLSFAFTTGFFALAIALFQPRYLGIFPRLLHPHLP